MVPTIGMILVGLILLLILMILLMAGLIVFIVYFVAKKVGSPGSRRGIKGKDRWFLKDHYFEFMVGTNEVHNICYHFDRMWGGVKVYSDEEVVSKGFRINSILDEPTGQNEIRFNVGEYEVHEVLIKVDSPLIFPLFRPYFYHIFVDNVEIETLKF